MGDRSSKKCCEDEDLGGPTAHSQGSEERTQGQWGGQRVSGEDTGSVGRTRSRRGTIAVGPWHGLMPTGDMRLCAPPKAQVEAATCDIQCKADVTLAG